MATKAWIAVEGAGDLPPDRLERVLRLGRLSGPELSESDRRGPQAYLVAQGSDTEPLAVHFHGVDQFQYFAHGAGQVGHHHVEGGTLHYSDALTPYGPLRPGPQGMSYLTLRPVHDDRVRYMPESSSELGSLLADSARPSVERRNLSVALHPPSGDGGWSDLLVEADELRVSVVSLAPHADAPPAVVAGRGAYALVVSGHLVTPDGVATRDALRWLDPGQTLAISTGTERAVVALAQFPVDRAGRHLDTADARDRAAHTGAVPSP